MDCSRNAQGLVELMTRLIISEIAVVDLDGYVTRGPPLLSVRRSEVSSNEDLNHISLYTFG